MSAVVVAGTGAIGRAVAEALARGDVAGCTLAGTVHSRSSTAEVEAALSGADVLVEATSVDAARTVVARAVATGLDVLVCSCGVLARPDVEVLLAAGPGRVLLPAGAIGGFDLLAAASRAGAARVSHTTVKRPGALGVAHDHLEGPVEVFRGTAREAALAFPRTSNASVALAFATVGLDLVEVVVLADPAAEETRHVVTFDSSVGHYELTFVNSVDSASGGRTSRITALSVLETLAGLAAGVGPGVVVLPRLVEAENRRGA
ncbi:aspartate dehydrogenase domain-containing protein [Nocardioides sp. SYSU DS0663]|uniref:aspartate dehydrogenase domain-containing protein n=1 Tax=Nocardioides sp. SYSU DS0663 TaxID=3416445 RepID=UPI003F4B71C8